MPSPSFTNFPRVSKLRLVRSPSHTYIPSYANSILTYLPLDVFYQIHAIYSCALPFNSIIAGQLIALQAFVPATIRKKLSMLHDEMPPMPASTAKNVINDELEKLGLSDKIFKSINLDQVLGSASIAQVHEAVLHEGNTHVAVKVQYPDMERIMMIDLANFRILGEVLQRTELNFDLITPIQEIAHKLAMEFDFVSEARGMNEIRYALRKVKGVNVPESIPGMVSRRLLVMTYLDGMPLTKLDEKLGNLSDKAVRVVGRKILKKLSACYGKMILTDGFFQADCKVAIFC